MTMARPLCVILWIRLSLTSVIIALLCTKSVADRPYACGDDFGDLLFCNQELPLETRVADLISRLSLEEKIGQLVSSASNVSRLGIPSYYWWSEALHGLSDNGPGVWFGNDIPAVTTFPQVILSAASFNRTLWNLIAQAVSTEARAMHNVGQAGLTFWSPNINIFRDPRWGRGQETPGEDPLLSSEYAVAYVSGLQGKKYEEGVKKTAPYELKVSACCKHFTAYDLENWGGYTRYTFDAVVSPQDFVDTYHPPFKSCVQDAEATCVMCSYNRVNGIPACADEYLLSQLTRHDWGFKGYITSDCDAVAVVYEYIAYSSSPEDAVADCLNAGMDLNCGTYVSRHASASIEKGVLNVSTIDRALSNLFSIQMRLGLFDGDPKSQAYGKLGPESVCTHDHQKLALEAAKQGLVLLKNEDNVLPLSTGQVSKIAVIGPNANASAEELLGNYAGPPCKVTTPLGALQKYADVGYQPGCSDVVCASDFLIQAAVDSASTADAVILFAGLDQSQEGEDHDRTNLVLPGQQTNLILRVANAAKGTVVLVVMSGGPVDISFARDSSKIKSIIWAGYPGEAGGQAIAEALFGEYSPAGKLPVTWYPQSFTDVPMTNMHMRANLSSGYPGRTYRFYKGDPVFEFGHGLSYLNVSEVFSVAPSEVMLPFCTDSLNKKIVMMNETPSLCHTSGDDDKLCRNIKVNVVVNIRNNGKMGGSHTVLLFSQLSLTDPSAPQKQLIDFKRISLEPNASKDVHFSLNPCKHLAVVNEEGKRVVITGTHTLSLNNMVTHSFLLRAKLLL